MSVTYEERVWHFDHLAGYPEGPWSGEPDKLHWVDEATGLDCLIVRNRMGALCGYVGLPPGHPMHGKGYDEAATDKVCLHKDSWECYDDTSGCMLSVHGGLTFASSCDDERPEGICHVPFAGRPGDVWWLGFDCAHAGDLTPYDLKSSMERGFRYPFTDPRERDQYRNVEYVKTECANLARQLTA